MEMFISLVLTFAAGVIFAITLDYWRVMYEQTDPVKGLNLTHDDIFTLQDLLNLYGRSLLNPKQKDMCRVDTNIAHCIFENKLSISDDLKTGLHGPETMLWKRGNLFWRFIMILRLRNYYADQLIKESNNNINSNQNEDK
jgi:hypothetical protein